MSKKPKHPMEFHIGFKTYTIVQKTLKKDKLYGYVDLATNTIYIDPSASLIDYKGTLLHEIYHIAYDLFGLGDDDEMPTVTNEFLTTITSNMTQLIWGLNRELFNYIFSDE